MVLKQTLAQGRAVASNLRDKADSSAWEQTPRQHARQRRGPRLAALPPRRMSARFLTFRQAFAFTVAISLSFSLEVTIADSAVTLASW